MLSPSNKRGLSISPVQSQQSTRSRTCRLRFGGIHSRRADRSGFALVISLALMAFVLLLLLSMTVLIRVETSVSQSELTRLEARQNALLAVNQAIGILQSEMGRDQRVSANADILNNNPSQNTSGLLNDDAQLVENPYLVGVWDSSIGTSADPLGLQEYDAARNSSAFRRWLVSGSRSDENTDGGEFLVDLLSAVSNTDIRSSDSGFRLIGPRTLSSNSSEDMRVWAPIVGIGSRAGGRSAGNMAWAVMDEGVKARFNLPMRESDGSNIDRLRLWNSPGNFGVESVGQSDNFSNYPRSENILGRVTGPASASLVMQNTGASSDLVGEFFHDISFYSRGVLSNVVEGGLRRDLSLLAAERPDIYAQRRLYSDTDEGLSLNPDADPHWSALLDFISLPQDSSRLTGGTNDRLPTAQVTRTDWKASDPGSIRPAFGESFEPLPAPEAFRLMPSIAKMEFFISLVAIEPRSGVGFDRSVNFVKAASRIPGEQGGLTLTEDTGGENTMSFFYTAEDALAGRATSIPRDGEASGRILQNQATAVVNGVRQIHFFVQPTITLHNPYNVPLDLGQLFFVVRDPPVGIQMGMYDHEGIENAGGPYKIYSRHVGLAELASPDRVLAEGANEFQLNFVMSLPEGEVSQLEPGQTLVVSPRFNSSDTADTLDSEANAVPMDLELSPSYVQGQGLYWQRIQKPQNRFQPLQEYWVRGIELDESGEPQEVDKRIRAHQGSDFHLIVNGDLMRIGLALADGTQNPPRAGASNLNNPLDPYNGKFAVEIYTRSGSSSPPVRRSPFQDDVRDLESSSHDPSLYQLLGRQVFDYNPSNLSLSADRDTLTDARIGALAQSRSVFNEPYAASRDDWGLIIELDYDQLRDTAPEGQARDQATIANLSPIPLGVFRVAGKVTQKGDSGMPYHPSIPGAQTSLTHLSGVYHIGKESSAFHPYDLSLQAAPEGAGGFFGPALSGSNLDGGLHFRGQDDQLSPGTERATFLDVPVLPLTSIANLQHADIFSGHMPRVRYAIGNSVAHPLLPSDSAIVENYAPLNYGLYDHSYLSNSRLWDAYYFSTLVSEEDSVMASGGSTRGLVEVVGDWLGLNSNGTNVSLINGSLSPFLPDSRTTEEVEDDLLSSGAFRRAAAYQLLEGAFNVNSTSVEAWKAVLSTTNIMRPEIQIPFFQDTLDFTDAGRTGSVVAAFSRFRIPNSDLSADFAGSNDVALWQGYRELNEDEIERLAEEIVKQVRYRGPFFSLAEFVNRRLTSANDPRSRMSALDAAIEAAELNDAIASSVGRDLDNSDLIYIDGNDSSGSIFRREMLESLSTATGAPAFLTQADILQSIGSKLTARSDTFVIRAYGEVTDIRDRVVARSVCEVVVQRVPEFLDTQDEAFSDLSSLEQVVNEQMGRRFEIVDFRWLAPEEI